MRLRYFLLLLALALLGGAAGPALAQPFTVSVSPAGPLHFCAGSSRTLTATATYSGFGSGTGFDDDVYAVLAQADGKVLLGGKFRNYDGAARGRVARINADGSLDAGFVPAATSPSTAVLCLALQADGKVLAGGSVTAIGGATRGIILRLNTDGSLDNTFTVPGTGFNSTVDAIVVQPDGKVLVSGDFNDYNGTGRSHVARLNADGSLDASFGAAGTFTNGTVFTLARQPDGKLVMGGIFTQTGGLPRPYVARLNADGTADASFAPAGAGVAGFGTGTDVTKVLLQPDGKVLMVGKFTSVDGSPRGYVARLNADGTLDTSFVPTGTGFSNKASSLSLQPDGRVLVGGFFTSFNGAGPPYLARLLATGGLDTSFASTGTGLDMAVNGEALLADGTVLVGGYFGNYNGIVRGRVARLNADGSLVDAGSPVAGVTYAWSNGLTTPSIAVSATGNYSVTATVGGSTATSNVVAVTVDGLPTITSISPGSGPVGTTLTIMGTNLGTVTSASDVTVNGTPVTSLVVSPSGTSLTAQVAAGTTTGVVAVTTPCGTATGPVFTVGTAGSATFQLLSTNPSFNAPATPATGALSATFNQPFDLGTLPALHLFGTQVGGHRTLNGTTTGNVLTVVPGGGFRPGERVDFTATPAARSASTGQALSRGHVRQLRVAAGAGPGTFAAAAAVPEGNAATAPALGDINGDGRLDLLIANSGGVGTVSVRLGLAGGGFAGAGAEVAVGESATDLVLADFDNDGDLDLATANQGISVGSVSIRLNNGSGSFGGTTELTAGTSPYALAAGDVDADGDLDLVVADRDNAATNVYVLRNTGAGSFGTATTVAVGGSSNAIALADFNNDGYLDLMATHESPGTASYRMGTGTGSFGGGGEVLVSSNLVALAVGDFDADGDADLAFGLNDPVTLVAQVVTLYNTGSGSFGGGAGYGIGVHDLRAMQTGDVDGDGDLDLITSNRGPATGAGIPLAVLRNDGTGDFTVGMVPCANSRGLGLAVADLDGDQDLDVVTVNVTAPARVWLNQALVPLAISSFTPASGAVGTAVVITGTGFGGAMSVSFNGTPASFVLNSPTQLTATVATGTTTGPITVNTACATATTVNNFVVLLPFQLLSTTPGPNARATPSSGQLTAVFNQPVDISTLAGVHIFGSEAQGHHSQTPTVPGSSGANSADLVPGPSFRPGELVQVSVNPTVQASTGQPLDRGHVRQYRIAAGPGPGTFAAGPGITVGDGAYGLALGDVNGDGRLDLLTVNGDAPGAVSLRLGLAGGRFSNTGLEIPVGDFPTNLVLADLDNDGDLDLATVNQYTGGGAGSGTVSVRYNAAGTFASRPDLPCGSSPYALAAGDVDADGDLDLVVSEAGGGSTSAYLLRNIGSGFASQVALGAGSGGDGVAVALADLNNDGYLDLVLPHYLAATLSYRLGAGNGSFAGGADLPLSAGTKPSYLAVGDFNADGYPDLALATTNPSTQAGGLSEWLSTGGTGFGTSSLYPLVAAPHGLAMGDVDGDGDFDLLSTHRGGNASYSVPLASLLNNGSGGFTAGLAPCANTGVFAEAGPLALADLNGDRDLDVVTVNGTTTASTWANQAVTAPAITAFSPGSVSAGQTLVITGVGFAAATGVLFTNAVAPSFTINSDTQITVQVPPNAVTGPVRVVTPCATLVSPMDLTLTYPTLTDLVVTTFRNMPGGIYRNVTVTGTGYLELSADLEVYGTLTLATGSFFSDLCHGVIVHGATTIASGATLYVCAPQGIRLDFGADAIELLGPYSLGEANYVYDNPSVAQFTGNALGASSSATPSLAGPVRSLTTNNAFGLTLSAPLNVRQTLTLNGSGNLTLSGNNLRLLSDASGTALVVNVGSGIVTGSTASLERYIAPAAGFTGAGYHHYSTPVTGNTVADFTATGFAPVVNPAYNTSASPLYVVPFPTVFGYDQSRLTVSNDLDLFSKGWVSPAALSTPLAVGKGYAVHSPATTTVDFTGILNTGTYTYTLARNPSPALATQAGWQLVGNPYPAPLDWSLSTAADRVGLDAAIYVFSATSAYGGTYRTYVNGIGGGSPLLAAGQGFFMRVSTGQTSATLRFRNAQRVTSFATQGTFQRSTADLRPRLRLSLQAPGSPLADDLYLYAEAGATAGLDADYDAAKLPNPDGLNLSAVAASGEALAIDGRPAFTASTVVPLRLEASAAGRYLLAATAVANLPAGLAAYLRDTATGQLLPLMAQHTALQLAAGLTTRYHLVLAPAGALSAATQSFSHAVTLSPNPAHSACTVTGIGAGATLELFDTLSRRVLAGTADASGTAQLLLPAGLAPGVYVVRSGGQVQRLVVE